ncbi:MAG TPA: glycosyltransferase family 39 protein, partial [Anaerolineae bacterium]|nr:glycosyltransferase family 39 protein [Anaerolineae bacterium]
MAHKNSPFTTCGRRPWWQAIHYSLFTILLLSLALNLHALAAENLWEDEIFTAIFANRPPAELIEWTTNDIHPPLYYLIAGAFTRLAVPLGPAAVQPTPASDWLWRFPSVVAGVLTVAVIYRLAVHVLRLASFPPRTRAEGPLVAHQSEASLWDVPRSTALSAALLLALAPIAIKYGQEARMHALFMFLSALSTFLLFRALAQPQQWSRWLAYALATTANLYTMYFGFLILATHAALLLFLITQNYFSHFTHYAPERSLPLGRTTPYASVRSLPLGRFTFHPSPLTGFIAAIALAFLLYIPWWPVLFTILRQRAAVGAIEGGVGSPLAFVPGVVRALGPAPEPVAWVFLGLFILGLILLARRNWPVAAFAALWLGLPIALPIVLGDPRALQFRYAFVLPIYLIVIAYALVRI